MLLMSSDEFKQHRAAEETWRVFRIMAEFVEGFHVMGKVGPVVSIFGSARAPKDNPYYKLAERTAAKLAESNFAVMTGGGGGVMEAANKGCFEAGGQSVGMNIYLPEEQRANEYHTVSMDFNYFFVRKVMFVKYAVAFICMPGGFGTMDEFFEAMTLIQTEKTDRFPIVLMGSEFWKPLIEWMKAQQLGNEFIDAADLDLFTITDDPDEAVQIIIDSIPSDKYRHRYPSDDFSVAAEERITAEGTRAGRPPRIRDKNAR